MNTQDPKNIVRTSAEQNNKCVFTYADLMILFDLDARYDVLDVILVELLEDGFFIEALPNIFVIESASSFDFSTIREKIAIAMRRGENMYVSMQTVLSDYQIISQISNALTVVTDGKSEVVKTKYGFINFYHLERPMKHLHLDTKVITNADGMRVAGALLALSDLTKLAPEEVSTVDMEEYQDVIEEEYTQEDLEKISEQ